MWVWWLGDFGKFSEWRRLRPCCTLCGTKPYNCEGSVKNPSIWKESLTWIVPRIRSVRGENLEG